MTGSCRFDKQNERLIIEGDLDVRSASGGRLLLDGSDATTVLSGGGGGGGGAADVAFTLGVEGDADQDLYPGARSRRVTAQLKDSGGSNLAASYVVQAIVTTDATNPVGADGANAFGYGHVPVATKGTVIQGYKTGTATDGATLEAISFQSGTPWVTIPATIASNASGQFDVDIVNTGAATFYLVVILPTGELVASDAIAFAG